MLKNKFYLLSLILIVFLESFNIQTITEVKYLPLGDSYTICTGATEKESWPVIMTQHLNEAKIKTTLPFNPSKNGFSTQNVIDQELPVFRFHKPNFVTLLIGVNDWVRQVPTETFKKNLLYILDEVQNGLPDKSKVILITIPDFGVTPQGMNFSGGRDISKGLTEFNDIIKEEGKKRNLPVVDIFWISKNMKTDKTLVAEDGLHPSAKEYGIWEKLIFKEAVKLLKK